MSVPNTRLSEADRKAQPGQFRVVKKQEPKIGLADSGKYFLVEDFPERYDALDRWRNLLLARRQDGEEDITYTVYDDHGRKVDAVGTVITEEERKAPPGKFRVICGDIASGLIRLVVDLDNKDEAIEYAKTANEGPYTGFQVHDDTGAALIPV